MKKQHRVFFQKTISIVTGLFLVVQSLTPGFFVSSRIAAQDAAVVETPTPTVVPSPGQENNNEATPVPTIEPTITPTEITTPTEEITPTIEPTPSIEPTLIETPTPTEEITPTIEPTVTQTEPEKTEPPKETSPPADSTQKDIPESAPTDSPTQTPTPTVLPIQPETGELQATILKNVKSETLDLDGVNPDGSAKLSTDKADYAPTDTAIITGIDFTPGESYTLSISSSDYPATSHDTTVTADEKGTFIYPYQLDGKYRPNYNVTVTKGAMFVTSTTFTDSSDLCSQDVDGANDVTASQKDLTYMCYNSNTSTTINTKWNWDDISWTGNNTGDACNLFDTDADGKVNYAVCVTIGGNPATIQSSTRYSCGDDKIDRCTNPITNLPVASTTSCTVQTASNDPFPTGDYSPLDTEGSCVISLDDVGGTTTSKLIDICSYPSQEPNSAPSDCVMAVTGQSGKLEITKSLLPTTDNGKFNLIVDSTAYVTNVGNGGSTGERDLPVGSYFISESAGDGTTLGNYTSSIECRDNNGTGGIVASSSDAGPLSVTISNNDDIICTITNVRINNASLTIIKNAAPNHSQDFSFTATGNGLSNFLLDDDVDPTLSNTKVFNNLTAGVYAVSEATVSGWTATSAICSDGSPITAIDISAGESVTCTFTNTKHTTLQVNKVTDPSNDLQLFPISIATTNGHVFGNTTGNLSTNTPITFEVDPGTYSVTETLPMPPGWQLDTNDCASVTLSAGQNGTCTIYNSHRGSVIAHKFMDQNNDGQQNLDDGEYNLSNWTMTLYGGSNCEGTPIASGVTLDDGTKTFANLVYGNYSVKETLKPPEDSARNWTNITPLCQNITLDQAEKTIHFANFLQGFVNVCKVHDINGDGNSNGEPWLDGWTFTLTGPNGYSRTQTTGDSQQGCTRFKNLMSGTYTATESAKPGWTETTPQGTNTFTVYQGGNGGSILLLNYQYSSITACKYTDTNTNGVYEPTTDTALANIEMILTKQNGKVWDPVTKQETTASGCTTFTNLTAGTYNVAENLSDPDLTGYYSTNSITDQTFTLTSGSTHTANFLNAPYRTISGTKFEDTNGNGVKNDGEPGIANWEIYLDKNLNGTYDVGDALTQTDANGNYTFTGLVGDTYQIGEIEQSGWERTMPTSGLYSIDLHSTVTSTENDFGNFRLGLIQGRKYLDSNASGTRETGENFLNDWTIRLYKVVEERWTKVDETITGTTGTLGQYRFDNLEKGRYFICEVLNDSTWTQTQPKAPNGYANLSGATDEAPRCRRVIINSSNDRNNTGLYFGNIQYGTITVTKYNDENGDGDRTGDPVMSGWTITATNQANQTTDKNGFVSFTSLIPDSYYIDEDMSGHDGWMQTNITCETQEPTAPPTLTKGKFTPKTLGIEQIFAQEPPSNLVQLHGGETVNCYIGNRYIPAKLEISKENNAIGDQIPGANILYTLTVKAVDNTAYGVKVTDLLPKGFVYRGGSWTASSNKHGALTLGEPTYHSPGTWDIGTIEKDEIITLTLLADISTDEKPGLYKDLALAYGCQQNNECELGDTNSLIATAVNPGQLDTTFVGTEVNIIKDQQDSKTLTVTHEEKQEGSVLGATTELPSTGANAKWIIVAFSLMIAGIGALIVSTKMRRYHA